MTPAVPPTDARDQVYDPLRRENLGRSVEWALLSQQPVRLSEVPMVRGCGIYALYYAGPMELYAPISSPECRVPVYVGKADPQGARTGLNVQAAWEGTKLRQRLLDHRNKLDAADDFAAAEFLVRFLVADDLFTPMAERLMISGYRPVWNTAIDGFGPHGQGGPREAQGMRPMWHELHPGVGSFDRMRPHDLSRDEIAERVAAHLREFDRPAPDAGIPGVAPLPPNPNVAEMLPLGEILDDGN